MIDRDQDHERQIVPAYEYDPQEDIAIAEEEARALAETEYAEAERGPRYDDPGQWEELALESALFPWLDDASMEETHEDYGGW